MEGLNPSVLSIAGFDPCGGAGLLADIKTFEALDVMGMGVVTGVTFQNDLCFEGVKWMEAKDISSQLRILKKRFEFPVIKIGLVENLDMLERIISQCNELWPSARIIWDPIVKASAGFRFHDSFSKEQLISLLHRCFLITPNTGEAVFLAGKEDAMEAAAVLSRYCPVLLKGGHSESEPGVDYLFMPGKIEKIQPTTTMVFPKHGSGCVLSSAITSCLAGGDELSASCRKAKKYIEQFLSGSKALLGKHYAN